MIPGTLPNAQYKQQTIKLCQKREGCCTNTNQEPYAQYFCKKVDSRALCWAHLTQEVPSASFTHMDGIRVKNVTWAGGLLLILHTIFITVGTKLNLWTCCYYASSSYSTILWGFKIKRSMQHFPFVFITTLHPVPSRTLSATQESYIQTGSQHTFIQSPRHSQNRRGEAFTVGNHDSKNSRTSNRISTRFYFSNSFPQACQSLTLFERSR